MQYGEARAGELLQCIQNPSGGPTAVYRKGPTIGSLAAVQNVPKNSGLNVHVLFERR